MLQKRLASSLKKVFVDRLTCMVSSAQFIQKYSLIMNSLCHKLHANEVRLFDAFKKYQAVLEITMVFFIGKISKLVPTIKLLDCYVMYICANNLVLLNYYYL